MQESPGAMGVDSSYSSNVPAFLTKLWTLVEDPDTNHLICWSAVSQDFFLKDSDMQANCDTFINHFNLLVCQIYRKSSLVSRFSL